MTQRCFGEGKKEYAQYHDQEWGVPVFDDRTLFEMLILEGAQAGLSWEIVLKKREAYRNAFFFFDPEKVASMSDLELEALLQNPKLIRNRRKIYAARQNAIVFRQIQKEFGSFSRYIWAFVDGKPTLTRRRSLQEVPCSTPLSESISKELQKKGMTFVGPKILYSFLQAVGIVNDHLADCPCSSNC